MEVSKEYANKSPILFAILSIMHYTDFHVATQVMRSFFLSKWFIEVHPQSRLSILAACEDPSTIATFMYGQEKRPLPQTGQMWLEYELLENPDAAGFFCVTTSYRLEPNPVAGRHDLIFPMFEFEMPGGMEALLQLETELLEWMWFNDVAKFERRSYDEMAKKFGVDELTHKHEWIIADEVSPVCFLTDFPQHTSPFWNMKREGDHAKKIDVLMRWMETIGSAERSCDTEQMRHEFHTISDWLYAKTLYNQFGTKRVEEELEKFLSHKFFQRCGGGIWMTRMIRAMRASGIMENLKTSLPGLRTDAFRYAQS